MKEILYLHTYVDPFLKALNQLTQCVYSFEQPVSVSEFLALTNAMELK